MGFTRRELGRMAAGAGLGALLGAGGHGRHARAQAVPAPRNLLVLFTPNGTVHAHWRPLPGGTLAVPAGSILEPLMPMAAHTTVLDELNVYSIGGNHEGGMRAMLTGENVGALSESAGMSVDQFVARAIGQGARFPSLELGVQTSAWGASVQTRMSYRSPTEMVAPDDQPASVYTRLFADLAGGPAAAAQRRARRQSVLDVVDADLRDLRGRVTGAERDKLDIHAESLRQLERSLDAGLVGATCTTPVQPALPGSGENDDFPAALALQRDLGVLALSCGLARVVSLQCSFTVSPTLMSWTGAPDGHHALSHAADQDAENLAAFVATERWYAGEVTKLLQALAAQPGHEAGRTLLDDTLVVWSKELGDSRLHDQVSVPFVVAGGGIAGGRTLRCGGATHNQLLVSICQLFGLTNTTFGDPAAGSGPLAGLV